MCLSVHPIVESEKPQNLNCGGEDTFIILRYGIGKLNKVNDVGRFS